MSKAKSSKPKAAAPSRLFDQARDELFSHILRCGVLEAAQNDQKEWFDDTMEYLGERYEGLSPRDLADLRQLGERYCQPVISRNENDQQKEPVGAGN
jgi:hypothetical protein